MVASYLPPYGKVIERRHSVSKGGRLAATWFHRFRRNKTIVNEEEDYRKKKESPKKDRRMRIRKQVP